MTEQVWLAGAAYTLGEETRACAELADLPAHMAARGVPYVPQLLGLGEYHTTRDVYQLATSAVQQTLERAGVGPDAVDSLVLSAATFRHDFDTQKLGVGRLLLQLGIAPRAVYAVSGSGCAAAVNAIDLASTLVGRGGLRRILVVNIDHVEAESALDRCIGYAFVSDSAASVLVSVTEGGSALLASSRRIDAQQMREGIRLNAKDNGAEVVAELGERAGGLVNVDKLLGMNTFLPVKKARERALGFSARQLYLTNVPRTGHCLGADALINWIDCSATSATGPRLLYAEADGHACGLLVQG